MDGVLIINKEAGMTSHDVVFKLRKILHIKKIGHTGTLDPEATGVLVVLVGKACKILPYIEDIDKEYIASMALGKRYDTDDVFGTIMEEKEIQEIDDFDSVLQSFKGKIKQVPPYISSIKVNGKKLYEYARQGIEVERPIRDVEIFDVETLDAKNMRFRVHCSSGTYIRSLCVDIASKTNNLGYMTSLVRSKVGRFSLDEAYTLKDVEEGNYQIYPIFKLLSHYKQIEYDKIESIYQGKKIRLNCDEELVLITKNKEPIAFYEKKEDGLYHSKRGLW